MRPGVARRRAARDREHGAARDHRLQRGRHLLGRDLLALEVLLDQLVGRLGDLLDQLVVAPLGLLHVLGGDVDAVALALPLGIGIGAHVDEVDDALVVVLLAHGHGHGDDPVGQARQRRERHVEVGALAVEQVHVDDTRQPELVGPAPQPVGRHLDARHAGDLEEHTLDDPQRTERITLERRIARRVDEVQPPPLPGTVREGRGDRHRAPLLVLVVVGDGRSVDHGSEARRLAALEQQRLDERRLPRPTMAEHGDVADLPGLLRHERSFRPAGLAWRDCTDPRASAELADSPRRPGDG